MLTFLFSLDGLLELLDFDIGDFLDGIHGKFAFFLFLFFFTTGNVANVPFSLLFRDASLGTLGLRHWQFLERILGPKRYVGWCNGVNVLMVLENNTNASHF